MNTIEPTQLWTDSPSSSVFVESSGEDDEMLVLTMEHQPDGAMVVLDWNEAQELVEIIHTWLKGYGLS